MATIKVEAVHLQCSLSRTALVRIKAETRGTTVDDDYARIRTQSACLAGEQATTEPKLLCNIYLQFFSKHM